MHCVDMRLSHHSEHIVQTVFIQGRENKKSRSMWKRQGKPTWCGEQKRPTQLQKLDMRIIQSQKTTEYRRETKQKQANGAQKNKT